MKEIKCAKGELILSQQDIETGFATSEQYDEVREKQPQYCDRMCAQGCRLVDQSRLYVSAEIASTINN